MTYSSVIRAARAVIDGEERPAAIAIADGAIAAIAGSSASLAADNTVELGPDVVLLPGLVDTHVHVNEPGRTDWEGFASATRAAAAGGVTTLIDMPLNSVPPTTTVAGLRAKQARAGARAHVDVGFWGGAIPGNVGDLAALHAAGVFGFKCFLVDSGVPEFPPLDADGFAAALAETARLGALMIVHAEAAELIGVAAPGADYAAFVRSRPPAAEDTAIARVLAVGEQSGGAVHVLHLSSASALPELARARAAGVDVSVETCPHYLTLDAEGVPAGATEFKCCPPIRDAANQDRLWAGLADGTIDMIVSDHSPSPISLKRKESGDFAAAWGGISSLQLGLPAVWTQAVARGHVLADVVRWMATAPADRLGLAGKGRIAVGADADLTIFDPEAGFTVDPQALLHRHPISAYAGRRLRGVVRAAWLAGVPIELSGPARGRLLTRGRR